MNTKNVEEEKIIEGKRMIEGKIEDVKNYAYGAKGKFDVLVADHPLAFVVGAFAGGLILGKILSDRR